MCLVKRQVITLYVASVQLWYLRIAKQNYFYAIIEKYGNQYLRISSKKLLYSFFSPIATSYWVKIFTFCITYKMSNVWLSVRLLYDIRKIHAYIFTISFLSRLFLSFMPKICSSFYLFSPVRSTNSFEPFLPKILL